jgi:hypothetical protein
MIDGQRHSGEEIYRHVACQIRESVVYMLVLVNLKRRNLYNQAFITSIFVMIKHSVREILHIRVEHMLYL